MLLPSNEFGPEDVPLWENVRETVYCDLLQARICGDAVLGEEASFGILVAVEVDHAHAQRAEQTKAFNDVRAGMAIVLRQPCKDAGTHRTRESPWNELMSIRVSIMSPGNGYTLGLSRDGIVVVDSGERLADSKVAYRVWPIGEEKANGSIARTGGVVRNNGEGIEVCVWLALRDAAKKFVEPVESRGICTREVDALENSG